MLWCENLYHHNHDDAYSVDAEHPGPFYNLLDFVIEQHPDFVQFFYFWLYHLLRLIVNVEVVGAEVFVVVGVLIEMDLYHNEISIKYLYRVMNYF